MICFTATIKKFATQGEKTGWTYLEIPAPLAQQLNGASKKSFRVKGRLDEYPVNGVALLPMGGGAYIMALNATMRNCLKKTVGATVQAQLERDERERELPAGFMECLADEPAALERYNRLPKSQRSYFSIWVTGVKTDAARAKRIAQAVTALAKGQDFGQMVRFLKKDRDAFLNG